MKPAVFTYVRAATRAEALAALAAHGPAARVLAGGQSLLPQLNRRQAQPDVLIDINHVADLDYARRENGTLHIGATYRQHAVLRDGAIAAALPLLVEALRQVGHPQTRQRGTVGGSLAQAAPVAELPAVALALDATIRAERTPASGYPGRRDIPAAAFFLGGNTTALAPDELLVDVAFPVPAGHTGHAFVEFSTRRYDWAVVGIAAQMSLDAGGVCTEARIALCGVADRPVRAGVAEHTLIGQRPTPEQLREAARQATATLDPPGDVHGSSRFRRTIAEHLVEQALARALTRAQGREP